MKTIDQILFIFLGTMLGSGLVSFMWRNEVVTVESACGICYVDGEICRSHPKAPSPHSFVCVNKEWEPGSP